VLGWSGLNQAVRHRVVREDEARPKIALEFGDASALNDFVRRSHDCAVAVVSEGGSSGDETRRWWWWWKEEVVEGSGGVVGGRRRKRKRKRERTTGLIYYLAGGVKTELEASEIWLR
jgi:hypothetical protein